MRAPKISKALLLAAALAGTTQAGISRAASRSDFELRHLAASTQTDTSKKSSHSHPQTENLQKWLDRAPPLGNGFVLKEDIYDLLSRTNVTGPMNRPTYGQLKAALLVMSLDGVPNLKKAVQHGQLTDSAIIHRIDSLLGPDACTSILQGSLHGQSQTEALTARLLQTQFRPHLAKFNEILDRFNLDLALFETRDPITGVATTWGMVKSGTVP